jgi:hypothetical protein
MRNDIAVIKSKMADIKEDLKTLHEKVG